MNTTWDPRAVLDINPESGGFTCVGITQQGRRCKNSFISRASLEEAGNILDELPAIARSRRRSAELPPRLSRLAYLTLCPRWHRDRIPQVIPVAERWLATIQHLSLSRSSRIPLTPPATPPPTIRPVFGHSTTHPVPRITSARTERARPSYSTTSSSRSSSSNNQTRAHTSRSRRDVNINVNIAVDSNSNIREPTTHGNASLSPTISTATSRSGSSRSSQASSSSSTSSSSNSRSRRDIAAILADLQRQLNALTEAAQVEAEISEVEASDSDPDYIDSDSDSDSVRSDSHINTPSSSGRSSPVIVLSSGSSRSVSQARSAAPSPSSARSTASVHVRRRPITADTTCYACYEPITRATDAAWCRGSCGQNICLTCHIDWVTSQRQARRTITCGLCRAPWVF
ncbi:hypothetical protein EG329_009502 [Mollisiaceae sp. DMI_Dod_QoI]|nr:hypothetical protein EG329_009502 [Helotiales sp. DMI_Dod_QoI]